jgi:hypothetical protein
MLTIWRNHIRYEYEFDTPQVPAIGEAISTKDFACVRVDDVTWIVDEDGKVKARVMAQ